ncbi:MAG TPA: AAA family ATPase [Candidatus Hydrogenedentes bacterium]|nr:AAA family ATPase [Candidatus Hydrogenedentota bacterium]HOL76041.1 AAA family ATPase [Candidatus Hydrogenedentota bacterium]HPO84655.1 AAA family ATPase [Candidatus Hydrogenedentota bacterium]
MRIDKIWIDGYGRFENKEVLFAPTVQVVVGPNEQGKSTLRDFIVDMLYGQKKSSTQRSYTPNHALRQPWRNPEKYGGTLVYTLDNLHTIEVRRIFDRKREDVQLFDRTLARDITSEFPKLKNGEPLFAEEHLGIGKELFLSAATVSHFNLDFLGEDNALGQMRERLLALTDTAAESQSAEIALEYLKHRIEQIGKPGSRAKPLPVARAQWEALQSERRIVEKTKQEIAHLEAEKRALAERIAEQQLRMATLEKEKERTRQFELFSKLQKAEELQEEIDRVTSSFFPLSYLRDFPLEQEQDLQRMANAVHMTRASLQSLERDKSDLTKQLESERTKLGEAAALTPIEEPKETEETLEELETRITKLANSIEKLEPDLEATRRLLERAQEDLRQLPDFDSLPPNPIERLNEMAAQFFEKKQSREQQHAALVTLRNQIEEVRKKLVGPHDIFGKIEGLREKIELYKTATRSFEERKKQLQEEIEQYRKEIDATSAAQTHYRNLFLVLLVAALGFGVTAYLSQNWGVYLPSALFGIASVYFLFHWTATIAIGGRARRMVQTITQEQLKTEQEFEATRKPVDELLRNTKCSSIRELEALYENYLSDLRQHEQLTIEYRRQERFLELAKQDAETSFVALQQLVSSYGAELSQESGIQEALSNAIARFHEFRDAKKRYHENKNAYAQLETLLNQTRRHLKEAQDQDRTLSLEVRERLRSHGFKEENRYTSTLKAVRAYRDWCTRIREQQNRLQWLQSQVATLENKIETEKRKCAQQEQALNQFLQQCGAKTAEEWKKLAEQAREYQKKRDLRSTLIDKLDTLLNGETLESLREAVSTLDTDAEPPTKSLAEIEEALAQAREIIETLQHQRHALDIKIAERTAGLRPLSELEESAAQLERRIKELELELEAAQHAYTLIEEIANEQHSRIAPQLATVASQHLAEITGGRYQELLLSRDLTISVRLPQTGKMEENPEQVLSKGTVDQVYFALRLALLDCISRSKEKIPLLLDDPFANYDSERLVRAIGLLKNVGNDRQIILFTCHEHVTRVARVAGIPVFEL